MAEIKIEKKKPVWPWVLVIIIILAAIFFFWYYKENDVDATDDLIVNDTISQVDEGLEYQNEVRDTSTLYTGRYGTVREEHDLADYLSFVDGIDNRSADKNYYRTAFFKLITATKREAEIKNVDVNSHISTAMENAEMLTNDPTTTKTSKNASGAAQAVAMALGKIQQDAFPNLSNEANAVQESAQKVESTGSMEAQNSNLDTFFDKSATLLQRMYNDENTNH